MGDLRVNVTASKTKSVTVKSNSVQTPISATPDLSLYYSDVAKDWAGKAENSANSAAGSAESANNAANSILNNEDVQLVITNMGLIEIAPENAQIAQEQAEIATEQAVISTEQATLATTQANLAKESANSAAENASIILEQTEAAQQSAVNANTSAVNADTSANSAREYMDNAEASAIAAKTSETNAKTSASEALASKNSANSSATSASTSATTATNKASEAKTSATQAANSATSAQSYAQEAKGYRDEAQEIADSMSGALNAYSKEETDALLDKKQDVLTPVIPIELKEITLSKTHNCTFVDSSLYANVKSRWTLGLNSATLSVTDGTNSYIDFPLDLNNQNNKVVTFSQVGTAQTSSTNVTTALGKLDANGDFYPIILLSCVGGGSYGYYTLATELNTTTVSGTRTSYTIPSTGQGIPSNICGLGITKVSDTQLYLSGVGSKYGARIGTFNSGFIKDINNVRVYSSVEGPSFLKQISDYGIYQGSANIGNNYSTLAAFVKGILNGEYTNEYDLSEITILNQINLKYDNQTIQVNSEGELVANLDGLGNEVNTLTDRVTGVETNLINKADVDLSNINASQSAKNEIISWGIPDYSALISISNGYSESNKFVAPATGLLVYNGITFAKAEIYVNDYLIGSLYSDGHGYGFTYPLTILLNKNDTFYTKEPTVMQDWEKNTFIPLKGVN